MNNYLIYGAGGHARVLLDLINSLGKDYKVLSLFNDSKEHKYFGEVPVIPYDISFHIDSSLIIGIGSARVRKMLVANVKHSFSTLIHPLSYIANDVEIGEGTVILAGAVIQAGAKIGKHVIINSNVTVDHDAIIADYVTTYPGVYIGAESVVSEGTTINPNAVIMRFTKTQIFSEIAPGEIFQNSDGVI